MTEIFVDADSQKIYIDVALGLPLDQVFAYGVPEPFQSSCAIGVRVLVPFGRKRITGYVVGFHEKAPDFVTRDILEISDDLPMFSAGQLEFFQWIARYYLHPLGEVIKAALPQGLERRETLFVSSTSSGTIALTEDSFLPDKQKSLLALLGEKQPLSLAALAKKTGQKKPSLLSLLRKMEEKNLVSVVARLGADKARAKLEKFILPGRPCPEAGKKLSQKRQQILSVVAREKEISLSRLRQTIPTAPRLVKLLAQDGYLSIEERQVFRDPFGDPVEPDIPPDLNGEQQQVLDQVLDHLDTGFVPYLLFGVTGSGKTEVYMRLVAHAVERGKTALILVPEIALISQTERRFRARFGEQVAVIHSMLSTGERLDQWRRIVQGELPMVIGTRSALFAPLENIGMIIVDEEHDSSYKQESGLRYNARDLCVVLARMHDCPVVLGSATPSVQSYQNVMEGRFSLLNLAHRVNNNPLPAIHLVDLKKYRDVRGNDRIITPELAREIRSCLDHGNQALIFLNRRGFASFPACKSCGKPLLCRHCDLTMTYHRTTDRYLCHLCGDSLSSGTLCPDCGNGEIQRFGFGTQKVEDILQSMFPDARLARMDQDSTARKGSSVAMLKAIKNRTVDIVVGTQILAKGHDFPGITLVGVVCADLSLNLPDFRAGERTFQLLAQVAGRAGRGKEPGRVVLQTYTPEHFTIEAARDQDFHGFFLQEAPFRKALMYPPFARLVQLKISGKAEEKVKNYALHAGKILNELLEKKPEYQPHAQILGPIEASISRISGRYRWQIIIKSLRVKIIHHLVSQMKKDPVLLSAKQISLAIDMDPYFLM